MKRLVQWHSNLSERIQARLGLSNYQHLWLAFLKGAAIGYIIGIYT